MKRLEDYYRGWIIGNFDPAIVKAPFEVGIQKYKAGESHEWHYHRFALETNIVVDGVCQFILADKRHPKGIVVAREGDIVTIQSNTVYMFKAVEPTTILCIKDCSKKDDKVELKDHEDPATIQACLWHPRSS